MSKYIEVDVNGFNETDSMDIRSAVSNEDCADAGEFLSEFTAELSHIESRLTGTAEETEAARLIRDRLHFETGVKTRLEAYKAYPLMGRGTCCFLGLWYALAIVLYFVSFAGKGLAGVLLTLLALVVFLSGMLILGSLFTGKMTFKKLLKPKVSYNVVSEQIPRLAERGKERTVVICANHDAVLGSYFQFDFIRKLTFVITPISAGLFIIFCILKMSLGADTASKISILTILPFLTSIAGVFVLIAHFSLSQKHARQNNGRAVSVALAAYAYFIEKPEQLPDDVKLMFVSFGGENSAHGGSEAFVKAHPELKSARVLCFGDINGNNYEVVKEDALRKIKFSSEVVSAVRASAREQDLTCSIASADGMKNKLNSLHGYTSGEFAKAGIQSATIISKSYSGVSPEPSQADMENLFKIAVGTIKKLLTD